jgi:tellurite resistance protein TehA-like permease
MHFPVGMYTVCTFQLSKAIGFEPLMLIPRYFVFIALAAWLVTLVGLIHSLLPRKSKSASLVTNA